jgi:hypothetical protein
MGEMELLGTYQKKQWIDWLALLRFLAIIATNLGWTATIST